MKDFNATPREMIASFWRNRSLMYSLIQRDVLSRYRGSIFGVFWSFFQPILMLIIYTFVFSVVFKARWNAGSDSKTEFALVLFSGLIVFNLFSECISRAPSLIMSHANYVKKVVFPLEILPWVSLGSALFQSVISSGVWLLFYIVFYGMPHGTIFILPFIFIPLIFITIGCSWMLSSLGVYLRDIGQMIGILITISMFLSPLFYSIDSLPKEYQRFLLLNPLTPIMGWVRDVLYWGNIPSIVYYTLFLMFSMLIGWLGFAWFQKTRKGFADVL